MVDAESTQAQRRARRRAGGADPRLVECSRFPGSRRRRPGIRRVRRGSKRARGAREGVDRARGPLFPIGGRFHRVGERRFDSMARRSRGQVDRGRGIVEAESRPAGRRSVVRRGPRGGPGASRALDKGACQQGLGSARGAGRARRRRRRAGSRPRQSHRAGARRARAGAGASAGQNSRSERALHPAQARRALRIHVHLRASLVEAGRADALFAALGPAPRRGRRRASADLRRGGPHLFRGRGAARRRHLSGRRIPAVRRQGGSHRHRGAAERSHSRRDPRSHAPGRPAAVRSLRIRGFAANDVADGLRGRIVRFDPSFPRVREPSRQEIGVRGGDPKAHRLDEPDRGVPQ